MIEESKARQVCGMKDQITFTDVEYGNRKKTTKREKFLNKMEEIIPWKAWVEMIRPYYPKGEHGRPVRGIETMLRMYLMQTWFNLSDEGTEDAIYDSYAMRSFLGINFMTEQVPDATTLLKFRHLLEKHKIGEKIFTDIRDRLEESGLLMHGGTIVDATIISAPSSTKNRTGTRDPEMHQTKKGNQWYHGMKVHAGVDAGTGYIHTIEGTAANVHDSTEATKLIREDDHVVYGDSGYLGVPKQEDVIAVFRLINSHSVDQERFPRIFGLNVVSSSHIGSKKVALFCKHHFCSENSKKPLKFKGFSLSCFFVAS